MRVIRKRPGQVPQVVEIEPSLEAMQREVDGWIETVTFAENACVVCSEEGRVRGGAVQPEAAGTAVLWHDPDCGRGRGELHRPWRRGGGVDDGRAGKWRKKFVRIARKSMKADHIPTTAPIAAASD